MPKNIKRFYFNGNAFTLDEWAKRLGVTRSYIHNRLYKGWTFEEIMTTPVVEQRKKKPSPLH